MSYSFLSLKILQNTFFPIEPRPKIVHGDGVRVSKPHYGKLAGVDSAPNLLVIRTEQAGRLLNRHGDRRHQLLGAEGIRRRIGATVHVMTIASNSGGLSETPAAKIPILFPLVIY